MIEQPSFLLIDPHNVLFVRKLLVCSNTVCTWLGVAANYPFALQLPSSVPGATFRVTS